MLSSGHVDRAIDELRQLGSRAAELDIAGSTLVTPNAKDLLHSLDLIFRRRAYDARPCDQDGLIVDCGAWIGVSTLRFAELFPAARVLCLEPDPVLASHLRANLSSFGLDGRMDVYQAACAGEAGTTTFFRTGRDSGALAPIPDTEPIEVRTLTLGPIIRRQTVRLLKLNVEGAETEIFEHLTTDDLRTTEQVLLEYHGFSSLPQGLHLILAKLDAAGFDYVISHYGDDINPSCALPLRLGSAWRYFLLVYARRRDVDPAGRDGEV